jgi:predicted DNA-binding protein (MmcQ/YjbR family)
MNVEDLRYFCLSLGDDVEEKMPFGKFHGGAGVLVFYVKGHMFCYFDIDDFKVINVKCQPERINELRAGNNGITDPYNLSAKHWIGMIPELIETALAQELIFNSYNIVKEKYTPKRRKP